MNLDEFRTKMVNALKDKHFDSQVLKVEEATHTVDSYPDTPRKLAAIVGPFAAVFFKYNGCNDYAPE